MKNDSDKTETGGTWWKRNHKHQNEHSSTFDLEWFKDDSTLIYWHTHHRGDQTLKCNKSGILVLVPTGGSVTTLFLLSLLLWTFDLYLILSYRYEDLLISWSYLLILSRRSYLGYLISWSTILSWSLDLIIWWWSKICIFIWTLHYYLHAFDMPLTHVFHWRSTCILHMLLRNMLLPYTW